jgi:hypothetical protein
LKTLEQQLNQVDDLLDQFRKYYRGKAKLTMADLRRSYDLLMMKVPRPVLPVGAPVASAWGQAVARLGASRYSAALRPTVQA